MFKDYYLTLEVDESVTQEEIKSAFKKQALIWHPDRNIGLDTTVKMQDINEAYLILKDNEARDRYNREYLRFKQFQRTKEKQQNNYKKQKAQEQYKENSRQTDLNSDYKVYDEVLNNWMNNAKQQAIDLAKQTIEDFKGMTSVGMKAATKEAGNQFIYQVITGFLFLIIFGITKSCNN